MVVIKIIRFVKVKCSKSLLVYVAPNIMTTICISQNRTRNWSIKATNFRLKKIKRFHEPESRSVRSQSDLPVIFFSWTLCYGFLKFPVWHISSIYFSLQNFLLSNTCRNLFSVRGRTRVQRLVIAIQQINHIHRDYSLCYWKDISVLRLVKLCFVGRRRCLNGKRN